jgi:hypothetical protein
MRTIPESGSVRKLTLRSTDDPAEFGFDACRDTLAVLAECYGESLLSPVVEIVATTEEGTLGDLWTRDRDDAE